MGEVNREMGSAARLARFFAPRHKHLQTRNVREILTFAPVSREAPALPVKGIDFAGHPSEDGRVDLFKQK